MAPSLFRAVFTLLIALVFMTAVRAQVLDEVRAGGELKVCMWPDYFGISYRNPRTGVFQGLDIDMSRAFAKELGVAVRYIETDFSRLLDDLSGRRCHIAMMAVGVTPQRSARVDFSAPYLRSDLYAITTRANRQIERWEDIDRPGRIVVVQKGTFMEPVMRQRLRYATLQVATLPGEREREVESGRADVFITDYAYSKRMLKHTDWARVIAPSATVMLTDYAYAVPKGEAAWLARVEQFVERIKRDGSLQEAAIRNELLPIVVRE